MVMDACVLCILLWSLDDTIGNIFWDTEINAAFSIYFSDAGIVTQWSNAHIKS